MIMTKYKKKMNGVANTQNTQNNINQKNVFNPFTVDQKEYQVNFFQNMFQNNLANQQKCLQTPCRFFLTPNGCKYGNNCKSSHNLLEIIDFYQLVKCPNLNCTNYCRGKQCSICHLKQSNKTLFTPFATQLLNNNNNNNNNNNLDNIYTTNFNNNMN